MSEDWDVESYRSEYENEEHWELKKNFMLAHKDKFPEDELVCLAQVFSNIEFLGCRYPEKTMIRVAELAKGVVESFREKRKNSLKRTFVAASDAASAKVKGQLPLKKESKELTKKEKFKRQRTNSEAVEKEENNTNIGKSTEKNNEKNENNSRFKYGGVKTFKIEDKEKGAGAQAEIELDSENESEVEVLDESLPSTKNGKLGKDFILLLADQEHPINLIQMNASLNKCTLRWEIQQGLKTCKLYLNDQCVGEGTGHSAKTSKEEAAKVAIAKLRESYYGVRVKPNSPETTTTVHPSELGMNPEAAMSADAAPIQENNIGRKLMKLMGWQGGGLGSREQGIQQPVVATLHVHKEGLGLKTSLPNVKKFKKHARNYIQSWVKSNPDGKLAFSADFSTAERKIMHTIAKSFELKSRSYGKGGKRQLVMVRKLDPRKIFEELIKVGGNSEKYELLPPTKC